MIGSGSFECDNLGGFEISDDTYYWSSSQLNEFSTWYVNFIYGNESIGSKDYTLSVRVIRAF